MSNGEYHTETEGSYSSGNDEKHTMITRVFVFMYNERKFVTEDVEVTLDSQSSGERDTRHICIEITDCYR